MDQGGPTLRIAPEPRFTLVEADLRELSAAARAAEIERRATASARAPFDLRRGPLLRAELLREHDRRYRLLLTLHHIVADGWSMGVLVREVAASYQAIAGGREPDLPALAVQYADYAVWQRRVLADRVAAHELAYWRKRLDGAPAALALHTDRPRHASGDHATASVDRVLPPALLDQLRSLGRAESATLFMILIAAYAALLGELTGDDDIVIGSPVAGRGRRALEELIGFFVNSIALRTGLRGNPTFRELLARVRTSVLGALAHAELPFDRLVQELRPPRAPGRPPIFQVWFALQNAPMPPLALPGLTLEVVEAGTTRAQFDLVVVATETPDGLRVALLYDSDLFEPTTAARLLDRFAALLAEIARNADLHLADLPHVHGASK
jgi:hypothetical protein